MFCVLVSVVLPHSPSLGTSLITIGSPPSAPELANTQSILQYFPWPSLLSWELGPLHTVSPSPLLPPSIDTASQGESEHTPSQMCVRCLNPNIEKHSTFIIWVSEKFRTFNSLLQPPTLQRKNIIVNQIWNWRFEYCKSTLFILMFGHSKITF